MRVFTGCTLTGLNGSSFLNNSSNSARTTGSLPAKWSASSWRPHE